VKVARAQYHLSVTLESKAERQEPNAEWLQEARDLKQKTQSYKQKLIKKKQLTDEQLKEDDIRIFDFVSALWSGCPELIGAKPFPLDGGAVRIHGGFTRRVGQSRSCTFQ